MVRVVAMANVMRLVVMVKMVVIQYNKIQYNTNTNIIIVALTPWCLEDVMRLLTVQIKTLVLITIIKMI